jgi:hypothetical protein
MKRFLLAAVLVCAAVVVLPAVAAKPQTMNLLEVGTVFVGAGGFDSFGSTPPKIGQGFVIGSQLYKWNGTKRGALIGTVNGICTFVTDPNSAGGRVLCTVVVSLPAGKLTVAGLIPNGETFTIPIVGGIGGYVGAKGYVEVTNGVGGQDSNKSNDKFVITG